MYIFVTERLSSGTKNKCVQIITPLLGHDQASDNKVDKEWLNESKRERGWR
jgi:hypothetical protein